MALTVKPSTMHTDKNSPNRTQGESSPPFSGSGRGLKLSRTGNWNEAKLRGCLGSWLERTTPRPFSSYHCLGQARRTCLPSVSRRKVDELPDSASLGQPVKALVDLGQGD